VTICNSSWAGIAWPSSKKNEILYCGYRYDHETGLYHVRNRHYHPAVGRLVAKCLQYLQRKEKPRTAALMSARSRLPLGCYLGPKHTSRPPSSAI
jgi:RHS repeat-associated protein